MYTVLIVIHVMSMIASMALLLGALVLGFLGKTSATNSATVSMVFTVVGAISGTILLFFAPLLSQCIVLTAYLIAATSLYSLGFGSGSVEKARFIRASASIQKR